MTERVIELKVLLERQNQDECDVDEFIRRVKQYADSTELTRAMTLELIERITIGERDVEERMIHIYYKLLGETA